MQHHINSIDDVLFMLDSKTDGMSWDEFYAQRRFSAPFIVQSDMPDENLVAFLDSHPDVHTALELGCGEGRNAIHMARNGVQVTAVDMSSVATRNAVQNAAKNGVQIDFRCENVLQSTFDGMFDFIYDSGTFHHLPPHRRLAYLDVLREHLKKDGFFGLTCFAWGERCADEVDDWEYYDAPRVGVAFTEQRLREIFGNDFETLEIRKYKDGVPGTIQGLGFMWACLFQKIGYCH